MAQRSTERERLYQDILSDGMRAIGYWGTWYDATWTAQKDIVSYELSEDNELYGGELVKLGRVNIETIAKGWQLLRKLETAGNFQHCGDDHTVRHTEKELAKGEWGDVDYDSCICDAVIQLATLGEIRYG